MIARLETPDGLVAVLSNLGVWKSRQDETVAAYLNATAAPRFFAAEGPAMGDPYVRAVNAAARVLGASIVWEEDPDEGPDEDPDGPPVIN